MTESGRLLVPVEPLEVGRCCQESVPARDNEVAVGGGSVAVAKGLDDPDVVPTALSLVPNAALSKC